MDLWDNKGGPKTEPTTMLHNDVVAGKQMGEVRFGLVSKCKCHNRNVAVKKTKETDASADRWRSL